ncbi:MAG: DUF4276 family protein [Planctomycetota bacterium]
MNAKIYIEGGGDSKELHARCREGFRKLLEKCDFKGRMPRLVACGGRESTFDDFQTAWKNARPGDFIAMLVDSEDPVQDIEKPWAHLKSRDHWNRPANASDDQLFLMTTCMETWMVADRDQLREYYAKCIREAALPDLNDLEARGRAQILDHLKNATRECHPPYSKGDESFRLIAKVRPGELSKHLPSFARVKRILNQKL